MPMTIAKLLVLAAAFTAAPVLADPCEGALPAKGTAFSGVARYVGDGDSLCVGPAGRPNRWIEVRLADFYAPELHENGGADAKRRLERLVMGRKLECVTGRRSYDRVIGACTLDGRRLGDVLRAMGAPQGGRGWRRP